MKFGKFELSDYAIGAIVIVAFVYIVLNALITEEKIREETKQLELQKEIILLERGIEDGNNTN